MRTLTSWLLLILSCSPAALAFEGDVNNDGTVNLADLIQIIQHVGRNKQYQVSADLNNDGQVNLFDIVRVTRAWGTQYPVLNINGTAPAGTLPFDTTTVDLTVNTTLPAQCAYSDDENQPFAEKTLFDISGATVHSTTIPLQNGVSYDIHVLCTNGTRTVGDQIQFVVSASQALATLEYYSAAPMGPLPLGSREATLRIKTTENATCAYTDQPGQSYTSMTPFLVTNFTGHYSFLTDLNAGQSYDYYVRCLDQSNLESDEYHINFTVPPGEYTTPTIAPASEFVTLSPEVEAVIGKQLKLNSAYQPWPWYDENQLIKGEDAYMDFWYGPVSGRDEIMYYDLGLVMYITYYRTGDEKWRLYAHNVTDYWYDVHKQNGTVQSTPRGEALGGLILRAMDGRPDMWPYVHSYTDYMFWNWIDRRLNNEKLHYGLRDSGYMLLYATMLAQVHPNETIRADLLNRSHNAAIQYYRRLQYPDGSWRWGDSYAIDYASGGQPQSQPFMVGLMLDGLVNVHKLTNDPLVKDSILRGVEALYRDTYRLDAVPELPHIQWRAMYYTTYCLHSCPSGAKGLSGGWDTNTIRSAREITPLTIHAFGYAYHITGDKKYLVMGDELASASWGKGINSRDQYYSLMDYRGKEYNQNYRSGGKYLAYRVMPVNITG